MRTRWSSSRSSFGAVLLISLLLCGCGDQSQPDTSAKSDSTPRDEPHTASADTAPTPARSGNASGQRAREQKTADLEHKLSDARAQQTRLLQQRAEIEARIAAHQEEGMELLNSLKTQSRSPEGQAAGFESRAKSDLEAVLAKDNSMTAELDLSDDELAQLESEIAGIEEELKLLRTMASSEKH